MRTLTITFHTAKNYGAVLQCYALQRTLKKYCDDVETIDFSTTKMQYSILPKGKGIKGCIKKLFALKNFEAVKHKYQKFDRFVSDNIKLTRHFGSIDELRNNPPDANLIITGSDQVFNPNRRIEERQAYYLDFPCEYRASYSASFGNSIIPEDKKNEITEYLRQFDSIAVREKYAVDMIHQLDENANVHQTIDPVFLLDEEEWKTVEEEYQGIPQKYILCFPLRESKKVFELTEKLAKRTGLPIVAITGKSFLPIRCKYKLYDVGPQNFLWLIRNCTYFVEDSFHATAFSLIFGKQFIFADDHPKSYERGRALLDMVDLQNAYNFDTCIENIQAPYNYKEVNQRLRMAKLTSDDYLRNVTAYAEEIQRGGTE